MAIHENIKRIIDERGLKQAYIARKVGLSANSMSLILAGKRHLQAEELVKIAAVLNVSIQSLVEKIEK